MDVQREFNAANRRIEEQIEANARAALVRIGVDVDAMDRAEAEARAKALRDTVEAWGFMFGALINAIVDVAEAFANGLAAALEPKVRP